MQRACFLLKVKPERIDEYKRDHKNVDPELLAVLTDAGIRNYSLFLREDGLLIGYLEAENVAESWAKVSATEADIIWSKKMEPYFDWDAGPIKWLEDVFYMP
jgi:L-rhamnose mutarotase